MKYQKLLLDIEGQLEALESGNGDILYKAEKGIALVEKSISSSMSSPRFLASSFIT